MPTNLLLNPAFEFHSFDNHRLGRAARFESGYVSFWNANAWGDVKVTHEAHAPATVRPAYSVRNLVSVQPGKRMWQFITLPDVSLAHGEKVSLSVFGHQSAAGVAHARIRLLKLDSQDGEWTPSEFGMSDKRTFPRHARGELVTARAYEASAQAEGAFEIKIEDAEIIGHFTEGEQSHTHDVNTIALAVELENTSDKAQVWFWSPSLCSGPRAWPRLPSARPMPAIYRHIPRTIQKLWKGEAIHILVMGSSIDRGSANPPMYLYDEDPASPTFKQPKSDRIFDSKLAQRPDLEGYIGWWQHYFSYAGRLRLELMRKFNLSISKICLNFMACDGSCVGEAHSGLREYSFLTLPPGENTNGHPAGRKWQELYPELFTRPEGPRPDLVIFGSGANEKTDTPDEVAVFEGMIRWLQRNCPDVEFIFCMFQNQAGYTPNAGDLQALALRYQIPFLDYGNAGDEVTRWCNRRAFVPKDGHPQAASHFLWFKVLERAFECWDPIETGQAQRSLPERAHRNTYGWEGDMVTYDASSPRIRGAKFIFDDTAINCWGVSEDDKPEPYVDGVKQPARRGVEARDIRNSLFRHGRASLGDRHVLEIAGKGARLTAVDAKLCPNRRQYDVDHPLWAMGGVKTQPFASEWGAPFGSRQALLAPGQAIEIDIPCTDIAIAYVDTPNGGALNVIVDGQLRCEIAANIPWTTVEGEKLFIENRKGITGLGYGMHRVRIEAGTAPVPVLGLFTYDSRPNRANERLVSGHAAPGETVRFTPAFRARPVVFCTGDLRAEGPAVLPDRVTFSGKGIGAFQAAGE